MRSQDYQELGKKHYKEKQYQKARDAFTLGIDSTNLPDLALLDSRAASHEKLGELNDALRDSRTMIKGDRKDVRGYLRTGKILQKMEKAQSALQIYQLGLRTVPVGDKNFHLLHGATNKLSRQLCPPKSIDPLLVLPAELAEMILGYLAFNELVRCLPVSKGWNCFLASRPSLWTHLDLSHANRKVPVRFIQRCIGNARDRLTHATLHLHSNPSSLQLLATRCKKLHTLELMQTDYAGNSLLHAVMLSKQLRILRLGVEMQVTLDMVTQICNNRPELVELDVQNVVSRPRATWDTNMPRLQKLRLSSGLGSNSVNNFLHLNLQVRIITRCLGHLSVTLNRLGTIFKSAKAARSVPTSLVDALCGLLY